MNDDDTVENWKYFNSVSGSFPVNGHWTYWGHGLDLSGSRDVIGHVAIRLATDNYLLVILLNQASLSPVVCEILGPKHVGVTTLTCHSHVQWSVIGHVTIRLATGHFLLVLHFIQVCISSRFRDNRHQTYWGHDLDLSGSHDVIGHMTIRLVIGHFLLVVLWNQDALSSRFRDSGHQTYLGHDLRLFWVTWRHLSRDHSTVRLAIDLPIGGPLEPFQWRNDGVAAASRDGGPPL